MSEVRGWSNGEDGLDIDRLGQKAFSVEKVLHSRKGRGPKEGNVVRKFRRRCEWL